MGRIYGCKLQIDFSCGAQERKLVIVLILIPRISLGSLGSQSFRYMLDSKAFLGTCLLGITIEGYFHYHKSITSKVSYHELGS